MSDKKWFDAKKTVQAKGPFYGHKMANKNGWDLLDEHAKGGYFIVLESNGRKRPVSKETFEERYDRIGAGD